MPTNGEGVPIEPSADVRASAHNIREVYLALLAEGFTEGQAMMIVVALSAAAVQGGGS